MVDFYVRPSEPVVRSLLQVKRVMLVGLRRGPRHQSVEDRGIPFDARTENIKDPN